MVNHPSHMKGLTCVDTEIRNEAACHCSKSPCKSAACHPTYYARHVIHASLAGVLGQGPRHGAVAFSDLRRVGWLLSLAQGAGGVVLPAFSLGIVMDGGARSGHLVGLAAEG